MYVIEVLMSTLEGWAMLILLAGGLIAAGAALVRIGSGRW